MVPNTHLSDSLRERKKSLARQALEQSALTLFAERGYDETTVEDIAAAAGVSKASFFRYFPAKEDVLAHQGDLQRTTFMGALTARPDDEPILACLQSAIREYADGLDEPARARNVVYGTVIRGSRTLLGQAYEIRAAWLRDLRAELGRRLENLPGGGGGLASSHAAGTSSDVTEPAVDPLPQLLAGITLSVFESALWEADGEAVDFSTMVDRGFALIRPDLDVGRRSGPVIELGEPDPEGTAE